MNAPRLERERFFLPILELCSSILLFLIADGADDMGALGILYAGLLVQETVLHLAVW